MVLTNEEAEEIKDHLLKQLNKFPEDKRAIIEKQVSSMNPEEVENFVEQNQLTHLGGNCIFCSIIAGKNPSIKIFESEENLAILEINPISKGNTLVLPKNHEQEIEKHTKEFAIEIIKTLKRKLYAKEIRVVSKEVMGHGILELIPIYEEEPNERHSATEEELLSIFEEIKKEPIKEETIEEKIEKIIPKMPPRIP